jgi:hypothetical protein
MEVAMRLMSRVGIAVLLLLALGVSGCESKPLWASFGTPPKPGYKEGTFGSVEALGYLVHEDPEGGFWALTDVPPGPSSSVQPKIIAVLLPGSHDLVFVTPIEGKLVWVAGRVSGAVSTRNTGPEMLVDALEVVEPQ